LNLTFLLSAANELPIDEMPQPGRTGTSITPLR